MDDLKKFELIDEDLEQVSGGKHAFLGNLTDGTDSTGLKEAYIQIREDAEGLIERLKAGNGQNILKEEKILADINTKL